MRVPNDRKVEVLAVCENIARQDATFKWEEQNGSIVVFSNDGDQAHKRGMWFIHRVDSRMSYKVEGPI